MCHRHLIKPVCVQYGRLFSQKKRLSYPAQQGAGKGFVKGESVPLDPLLVPFGGAKGTPRRRAVQIMITKRLAPPKAISRYNLTGRGGWDSEPSAAGGG